MKVSFAMSALVVALGSTMPAQAAKNVILLVSDGGGTAPHQAAELWTGAAEPYNNPDFIKAFSSTYALRKSAGSLTSNAQDPNIVYDPTKYWDSRPGDGIDALTGASQTAKVFEGYEWSEDTNPDSANTMSAMMTGKKTYNGGMNVDGFGVPLLTAAEVAKLNGKSVGSISSVRYNHATIAAGAGAHNISRNNYLDLSYEMFAAGVADVIGGAGNPEFDENGQPVDAATLNSRLATGNRFDADLWNALQNGTTTAPRDVVDAAGATDRSFTVDGSNWQLVTTKTDIQNLASGATTASPGKRLVMIPEVYGTLQYERSVSGTAVKPGDDAYNTNVPTLADMTNASLNFLDDNPDGFFLAIEGGAVDWADHGNNSIRLIEEQLGFNAAAQAVIDYLDAGTNGNDWSNTLVIVTADHDHVTFGESSDTTLSFADVTTADANGMPIMVHHSTSHGNALVPTWIRGMGAADLASLIHGVDTVYGNYIDQTGIGSSILANVPEPASLALVSLTGLALARRRRNA